jgi:hypothetical protein
VDGLAAELLNITNEAVYIIFQRFYYKSLVCGAVLMRIGLPKFH